MAGCCLIRAVGVLAAALALTAHAAEVKLLADGVTVLDGVRYAPVGEAETALGSQAGRAKCRQLTKALREAAEARDPATAGFVPALLMPVPLQPKAASVPSVAVSLRRAGRDAYLIAAHSGAAEVTAELDVFDEGVAAVDVLWENRTLAIAGTTLRDTFAPGATHVYHWRMPDVEYVGHQGEEGLAPNHSHPAYDLSVRHGLERIKLDLHETSSMGTVPTWPGCRGDRPSLAAWRT